MKSFPVVGNNITNAHRHYLCPEIADSRASWLGDGETWFLSGIAYPSSGLHLGPQGLVCRIGLERLGRTWRMQTLPPRERQSEWCCRTSLGHQQCCVALQPGPSAVLCGRVSPGHQQCCVALQPGPPPHHHQKGLETSTAIGDVTSSHREGCPSSMDSAPEPAQDLGFSLLVQCFC